MSIINKFIFAPVVHKEGDIQFWLFIEGRFVVCPFPWIVTVLRDAVQTNFKSEI